MLSLRLMVLAIGYRRREAEVLSWCSSEGQIGNGLELLKVGLIIVLILCRLMLQTCRR